MFEEEAKKVLSKEKQGVKLKRKGVLCNLRHEKDISEATERKI